VVGELGGGIGVAPEVRVIVVRKWDRSSSIWSNSIRIGDRSSGWDKSSRSSSSSTMSNGISISRW